MAQRLPGIITTKASIFWNVFQCLPGFACLFARFWDCSGFPWFSVEDAGRRPGRCWNVLCIRKNIRRAYREADKSRWGLPLWEELIVWFLILLFSLPPPPPRPCHSSHLLLNPALLSPTLLPENNVEDMSYPYPSSPRTMLRRCLPIRSLPLYALSFVTSLLTCAQHCFGGKGVWTASEFKYCWCGVVPVGSP